jgi:hypothetical protein
MPRRLNLAQTPPQPSTPTQGEKFDKEMIMRNVKHKDVPLGENPKSANDSKPAGKPNKTQISLTLDTDLLARLGKRAKKMSSTRASLIRLAIIQLLDKGLSLDGEAPPAPAGNESPK